MPDLFRRLLIALLLLAVMGWLLCDYQRFLHSPLQLTQPETQQVDKGWSQHKLIQQWQAKGWLPHATRDPLWLRLQQRLGGGAATIKAGEYAVRPGETLRGVLKRIQAGDTVRYGFTIVEGWTFTQLRQALAKQPRLQQKTRDWDAQAIMQALGKADVPPEGHFLPETYHYVRGNSDLDILRKANRALDEALQTAWPQRQDNLPLDTPQQALVLASIVEKETALAQERALIAGVFVNRLRKGMRLQTDPTVIYGLGTEFDGNLRRRDLTRDTPFNTYTRAGLPPTPIALPGKAAIMASLHPEATEKLYFVATGEGGAHYFSSNLPEHQAAVRRYQLNR